MLISNRPGFIGVVAAVASGFWMDPDLPPGLVGRDEMHIHLGALVLGLYALTVDRCEVPGLLASYKANVQNLFALAAFADIALAQARNGRVTQDEIDRFFFVPGACLIAWWAYALLTERLGLRRRLGKARDGVGLH